MRLPHELESEECWQEVEWVLQDPYCRASAYTRPMFEIEEPAICEMAEATEEYCVCPTDIL